MCSVPVLALPNLKRALKLRLMLVIGVLELYCHKEAIPLHF
jgi:hypothetical protein